MVNVRQAKFSDYTAIAGLHAKSWQETYRGIYSDKYLNDEAERDRAEFWRNRLQFPAKDQRLTLAFSGEDLAGFSCLLLNNDPVFGSLLDNLHVAASFKGSGIGKLLMKRCAKIVYEEADNNKMYLWVYASNKNAINVYERLGGRPFEMIEKQFKDGSTANSYRYVWNDIAGL